MSNRLRPFEADRLRSADLTYDEVGGTLLAALPSGFHHLERTFAIGGGRRAFNDAAKALMSWKVQRGAGLAVTASDDVVELGAVAVVRLGWGPLRLGAPVRVVSIVSEPARRGFAYGTLPGHPECGEELFVVELQEDDSVTLRIRAFSKPGSRLARAAGPLGKLTQAWVTGRYGRALRA